MKCWLTFDDDGDVNGGVTSIIASAAGIRSSLVSCYRRYFQHAPSRLMMSAVITVLQLLQQTDRHSQDLTSKFWKNLRNNRSDFNFNRIYRDELYIHLYSP